MSAEEMAEEPKAATPSSDRLQERGGPRRVDKESQGRNKKKEKLLVREERRRAAADAREQRGVSSPQQRPDSAAAKGWFRGLGAEERAAAASFADEAFLGTLLACAATWSGSSNQPRRPAAGGGE